MGISAPIRQRIRASETSQGVRPSLQRALKVGKASNGL
jgi:hypothetical protein